MEKKEIVESDIISKDYNSETYLVISNQEGNELIVREIKVGSTEMVYPYDTFVLIGRKLI